MENIKHQDQSSILMAGADPLQEIDHYYGYKDGLDSVILRAPGGVDRLRHVMHDRISSVLAGIASGRSQIKSKPETENNLEECDCEFQE
jgi:hypothetical protein